MRITSGPRLAAEGELLVTCLECGRRWKVESELCYASLVTAMLEEGVDGLRDHECHPRPRLVTN